MTGTEIPMVSVVVSVYNVEPWLQECLDSITGQTLRNIEIICVNDGSTDGSSMLLRKYAEKDHRIQIIEQDNKGLSEARNRGAREAKGKYLYFMDSDDVLDHTALDLCSGKMEEQKLEFLCFNAFAYGCDLESAKAAGRKNNYYRRTLKEEKVYDGQELFAELIRSDGYIVSAWSCVLLRTAFIEKNLWFHPGILHEDEPWMFAALMSLSRCGCIDRALYRRRMRNQSITRSDHSFDHVYGMFSGFLDAQRMLAGHPEFLQNREYADLEIAQTITMQTNTIQAYRACGEEERQKKNGMSPEERLLFEQTVVFPASLLDNFEKVTADNQRLYQQNDLLEKQFSESEKERKQLHQEVILLRESVSYRLGRRIVYLPGKIKLALEKDQAVRKIKEKVSRAVKPEGMQALSPERNISGKETDLPENTETDRTTVWIIGTPEHNNLGDQCIAEAEYSFLRSVFPDVKIREISNNELLWKRYSQLKDIRPSQLVFFHGGGNLGTLWPLSENIREQVIPRLAENRKIIFPQSIWFSGDEEGRLALSRAQETYRGDHILLCCRDRVSWQFAKEHFSCRSILVPDIVMWETKKSGPKDRHGALTLLRSDKERKITDTDALRIEAVLAEKFLSLEVYDTIFGPQGITSRSRKKYIKDLVRIISSMECVVTDRLHGMILCAVTETPCIVFRNGYHKVEAAYEWLKDLKYIRLVHKTDELEEAIDSVCGCTGAEKKYPEKQMQSRFRTLVELIRES